MERDVNEWRSCRQCAEEYHPFVWESRAAHEKHKRRDAFRELSRRTHQARAQHELRKQAKRDFLIAEGW